MSGWRRSFFRPAPPIVDVVPEVPASEVPDGMVCVEIPTVDGGSIRSWSVCHPDELESVLSSCRKIGRQARAWMREPRDDVRLLVGEVTRSTGTGRSSMWCTGSIFDDGAGHPTPQLYGKAVFFLGAQVICDEIWRTDDLQWVEDVLAAEMRRRKPRTSVVRNARARIHVLAPEGAA